MRGIYNFPGFSKCKIRKVCNLPRKCLVRVDDLQRQTAGKSGSVTSGFPRQCLFVNLKRILRHRTMAFHVHQKIQSTQKQPQKGTLLDLNSLTHTPAVDRCCYFFLYPDWLILVEPFRRKTHKLLVYISLYSLLVLLDLSAAFDTIDHNILLNRLENSVGISGSALAWFKSYLSDHHQFVAVNEEVSYRSQVQYEVPQGSVLGPLLFTLYMLPLGNIIRKHGLTFTVMMMILSSLFLHGETHQIEKLMECIVDIKTGWWIISYY